MTRTARIALALLSPWILVAAVGCSTAGTPEDDGVDAVQSALELDDGGFDLETVEEPMFGIADFESWYADIDPLTETMDGDAPLELDPADEPPDGACAHGFVQGRYRHLRERMGVGRGRILNADREVIGHFRMIWGTRRDGTHVAFGKAIDLEGNARAVFRGVADDGHFRGQWARHNGNHGVMGGRYGNPRRIPGGVMAGRWHRVDCDDATAEVEEIL